MTFTVIKKNIIANFAGSGWNALLGLVLIPIYVKFLGIEAWGVIGIFTSLQSMSYLLDLGLSTTLNREMARLSLHQDKVEEMRDLVRTYELIYWALALGIGAFVFAIAPLIANRWVQSDQIPPETITSAIRLMGLAITFQWPFALYSGGLRGQQRQVLLSVLNIGLATLRGVGVVLILWRVSPTLQAFFLWQVVSSFLQTCLAGWLLWHSIPATHSASRFRRELLRRSWRFAVGMSAVTVMTHILTQMDKVILSRLLSLEMFGYYVLASSVATSLFLFTTPVFYAFYPRFTQLVSLRDNQGLKEIYHHSCQLLSALSLPITVILVLYSKEILMLWTRNSTTVAYTHQLLSILIVGAAVKGLLQLPNALQIAHGWNKLRFYTVLISVVVLTPLLILAASFYGAVGAALALVIFKAGVALATIHLMHGSILKGEQWRWYTGDVGLPLGVSLGAAILCRILVPTDTSSFHLLVSVVSASLFVMGLTVLVTPVTRGALISFFRAWQSQS